MKACRFWPVIAGLILLRCSGQSEDARNDAKSIQGAWTARVYIEDGKGADIKEPSAESPDEAAVRWIFKANRVSFVSGADISPVGTVKLNSATNPKTLDIVFPPVPGGKAGQTLLGIFEVKGDTLRVCYAPDGAERPKEFRSPVGSELVLIEFRRGKR